MKVSLLIVATVLLALPAAAEDWTTTDGTKYAGVRVVRVEDDAVTIIYKDGGALVPLYKLPQSLQERFDYDPIKAKVAAEKRAKEDSDNAAALQVEIEQADKLKRKQQIQIANEMGNTNAATP